jgi:hypothetical protein
MLVGLWMDWVCRRRERAARGLNACVGVKRQCPLLSKFTCRFDRASISERFAWPFNSIKKNSRKTCATFPFFFFPPKEYLERTNIISTTAIYSPYQQPAKKFLLFSSVFSTSKPTKNKNDGYTPEQQHMIFFIHFIRFGHAPEKRILCLH